MCKIPWGARFSEIIRLLNAFLIILCTCIIIVRWIRVFINGFQITYSLYPCLIFVLKRHNSHNLYMQQINIKHRIIELRESCVLFGQPSTYFFAFCSSNSWLILKWVVEWNPLLTVMVREAGRGDEALCEAMDGSQNGSGFSFHVIGSDFRFLNCSITYLHF